MHDQHETDGKEPLLDELAHARNAYAERFLKELFEISDDPKTVLLACEGMLMAVKAAGNLNTLLAIIRDKDETAARMMGYADGVEGYRREFPEQSERFDRILETGEGECELRDGSMVFVHTRDGVHDVDLRPGWRGGLD